MSSSELSDRQWDRLAPLLPSTSGKRGGRFRNHRLVVEGICWKIRTGSPWRDIPERFVPWQTAWKRHDKWSADGTWERLLNAIQAEAEVAGEIDWDVSVDSTIARAHQHSAGARPGTCALRGGSIELQESAPRTC